MNKYELWLEPSPGAHGNIPARKLDDIEGPDFNKAVELYVSTIAPEKQLFWEFNEAGNYWAFSGIRAHENQHDAETGKK